MGNNDRTLQLLYANHKRSQLTGSVTIKGIENFQTCARAYTLNRQLKEKKKKSVKAIFSFKIPTVEFCGKTISPVRLERTVPVKNSIAGLNHIP